VLRLVRLDYASGWRQRRTWIAAAMLAYGVLSMPLVVERPPVHVQDAIAHWFGDADRFTVFLFIWIDLAMNKIVAFVPVILAGGILLTERDTGLLPVLAAKPLTQGSYFLVRATAACLTMLTLHALTTLGGAVWFSWRIPGFRQGPYLDAMILHAFAAAFATAFTAAVAVGVGRRLPAALVSVSALGSMAGLALIGFYQPQWRLVSYLNPLTLGSLSLSRVHDPSLFALLPAVVALILMTGLTLLLGTRLARRVEVTA
jgi:ABC-2 type transport system permease protein